MAARRSSRFGRRSRPRRRESPPPARACNRPDVEGDDADPVAAARIASGRRRPPREPTAAARAHRPSGQLSCRVMPSMPASISACAAAAIATAPMTFGVPASSRSGSPAQCTSSRVTISTVPPPWYSGAPCRNVSRRPISAPVPNGAYILCADIATIVQVLRVVVRLDVDPAVRRELRGIDQDPGADRVRLPRQAMDGLDEPGDVRGAADGQQRDPAAVGGEQPSTSSSSSRPSAVTRARTTRARARQGRSFE